MLQFQGSQEVPLRPEEVRAKLGDARFLVECIPDRQGVSEASADSAVCRSPTEKRYSAS